MITTFAIQKETPKKGIKRLWYKFKPDFMLEETHNLAGTALTELTYVSYKDKVNWRRVAEEIGEERSSLVCSAKIKLPEELGFKRYVGNSLMYRMAGNAALQMLEDLNADPNNITVCLVDFKGKYSDLVPRLLSYTNNLKVVTNNISFYMDFSSEMMEEHGAAVLVHKRVSHIKECDVVIAPAKITTSLPISQEAVVFTGAKPGCRLSGIIYDGYSISLPGAIKKSKPQELSDEYFAQALYEKGGVFSLGSLVPEFFYCAGEFAKSNDVCRIIKGREMERELERVKEGEKGKTDLT